MTASGDRPLTPQEALGDRSLARNEALLLLACASGRTRESLLAAPEICLPGAAAERYRALRDRRVAGEPIAYLIGHREFHGRRFAVDPRVLIPRPETELLIELAIAKLARGPAHILDLGTGSGVIAVTLALEIRDAQVTGADVSHDALDVARANAAALQACVDWQLGSWFDALPDRSRRFDLIVSNPPYVAAGDRHLGEGDLRFEPAVALTDGDDGLSALRTIVAGAPAWLAPDGWLMVEHGHDQAATVRALFDAGGLIDVTSVRDLAGIERTTVGRRA